MRALGAAFTAGETLAFVAAARRLVGVRFKHQGRSVRGVDCAGTAAVAMQAVGREIVDVAAYGREPQGGRLQRTLELNLGPPVERGSLRAGDVVLMCFDGEPSHVGLIGDYVYGGLSLIHGYATVRRVVEHRLDADWLDRITEVYRP